MNDVTNTGTTAAKAGWRVPEWAAATGISRSLVYELMTDKKIESVKLGAARIVITPPAAFLASLPRV